MRNNLIFLIFLSLPIYAQKIENNKFNLLSPTNVKKFADYLYCSGDYLRAILEYNRYSAYSEDDTTKFKIALSYLKITNLNKAYEIFNSFNQKSLLFSYAEMESNKIFFQQNDYKSLRNNFNKIDSLKIFKFPNNLKELYYFSYLLANQPLPPLEKFLSPFEKSDLPKLKYFYEWKSSSPYKSTWIAAILSALIPGLGKAYVNEYADGITALLATASLSYLSYSDFKAGHIFRGWVFGGIAAGFYAGNIYGSIASTQIYNVKIQYDFVNNLKVFIGEKKYFTPEIEFCK